MTAGFARCPASPYRDASTVFRRLEKERMAAAAKAKKRMSSAEKRHIQSIKSRDRNRARRSLTRSAVRRVREAVAAGDAATIATALSGAYSALDTAAKVGAIHTGKADRQKRRLAALVTA
jgi:small subunit ribosomal protein S20